MTVKCLNWARKLTGISLYLNTEASQGRRGDQQEDGRGAPSRQLAMANVGESQRRRHRHGARQSLLPGRFAPLVIEVCTRITQTHTQTTQILINTPPEFSATRAFRIQIDSAVLFVCPVSCLLSLHVIDFCLLLLQRPFDFFSTFSALLVVDELTTN